MSGNIGNIDIGSSFSTAGLAAGIKKARGLLQGFSDKLTGVGTVFSGFAAAVAANTAFQTISSTVQSSMENIDKIGDSAQQLGTTVANLSALQHAVNLTGSEMELLAPSIQKMNINLSKAGEDSKAAQAAFAKLGLDAKALKELDPSEAFILVAEALAEVPNQADRASAAMAIFGKSGTGLLNTLSAGKGTIRDLMDEAVQMGIAFNDVDAANIGAAKDALDRAQGAMTGVGNALTIGLAPSVERVSMQFVTLAKNGSGTAEILQGGIYLVEAGVWLVVKAVNLLGATFKTVQGLVTGFGHVVLTIFQKVGDAIDWINSAVLGMKTNIGDGMREAAKDLGKLAKEQFGQAGGEIKALAGFGEAVDALGGSSKTASGSVKDLGGAFSEAGDAADESGKKIQAIQDKAKDQLATFGMTADQIEIYKLRQEGATEAVIANVEAIQRQIKALEDKKKLDEKIAADAKALIEANMTPLEKYQQELQKIDALVRAGAINPEMAQRAADKAKKTMDEANKPKSKTKEDDPDKEIKADAKRLIEANMTPLEKFWEEIRKAEQMLDKGLINPEQFNRARLAAEKDLKDSANKGGKKSPFIDAVEVGSKEFRMAELRAKGLGGKDPNSKIEENTKEQVAQAKETNRLLSLWANRSGNDGGSVFDFQSGA